MTLFRPTLRRPGRLGAPTLCPTGTNPRRTGRHLKTKVNSHCCSLFFIALSLKSHYNLHFMGLSRFIFVSHKPWWRALQGQQTIVTCVALMRKLRSMVTTWRAAAHFMNEHLQRNSVMNVHTDCNSLCVVALNGNKIRIGMNLIFILYIYWLIIV